MKVGFGLADITIDGEKMGLQGDSAELEVTPNYLEVETYELGIYDHYLDSWTVKLKVVFQEEGFDKLKLAMPALYELQTAGAIVGLTDGAIHVRMRDKAKEIIVHPRDKGASTEYDVTIYKAFPTGTFTRVYGKETVKYEVEFMGLPLTGDGSTGGNYFCIGDTTGTITP